MLLFTDRIRLGFNVLIYLLLPVILVISFPAFAQKATGFAKGKVIDSSTNKTLLEATVFSDSASKGVTNSVELSDMILGERIQPGSDKNGSLLLQRLNGVVVINNPTQNALQSLNLFGMGERYNQVILNGTILQSSDPVSKMYPFEMLPVEAIEKVTLQKIANPSVRADFAGGTIAIKTKDIPDRNFFYIRAGTGFSNNTGNKDFFGDKRGSLELLTIAGSGRNLPCDFPTTRSRSFLNELNQQEQVYFSKQLTNNLDPQNYGHAKPDDHILLGFGKMISLKKDTRLGISAYLNHQKSERIDENIIQVAPDIANNPYPFPGVNKVVIRSQSHDINYRYASSLSGIVNATIMFGANKISLKSFLVSQLNNMYTSRTGLVKPDEDTLAHAGVMYKTQNRKLLNIQLSGEHALGKSQNFMINWQAAYTHYRQKNPDERNLLLRPDSTNSNTFELSHASAASLSSPEARFTNSGRLWRNYSDHVFVGAFNISVPFSIGNRKQYLSGGIYAETQNREYYSDFLLVQGPGYYTLNGLLDPERYYPGGLSVQNYFTWFDSRASNGVVLANNRGSYTASSNLGASYIMLESVLAKRLSLHGGVRAESISQLVSNTEYRYFTGFRNPRITPLDQNSRVNKLNVLPAVNLIYQPLKAVQLHAAWFKTVNRPQLQELSASSNYDASSFIVRTGNPILAGSTIDNFDGGVDWHADAGTHISVSGIYKKIDQPVEYMLSAYANAQGNLLLMPHNSPPAEIYGLQASYKVNFGFMAPWLSNVSMFANGNWLKTKVSEGPLKSVATPFVAEHTLSGSPEYTVNAGLVIQHSHYPMLTVLYSRTGDYISAVGSGPKYTLINGNTVLSIPDYRVKGRDQLDIQLSQKLFKAKLQIIAGVNNLLNDPYIEYQDLNGNKRFDAALAVKQANGSAGFYESGVDNTIMYIKQQQIYYISFSYLFR